MTKLLSQAGLLYAVMFLGGVGNMIGAYVLIVAGLYVLGLIG